MSDVVNDFFSTKYVQHWSIVFSNLSDIIVLF
jgi:hypothetical protein